MEQQPRRAGLSRLRIIKAARGESGRVVVSGATPANTCDAGVVVGEIYFGGPRGASLGKAPVLKAAAGQFAFTARLPLAEYTFGQVKLSSTTHCLTSIRGFGTFDTLTVAGDSAGLVVDLSTGEAVSAVPVVGTLTVNGAVPDVSTCSGSPGNLELSGNGYAYFPLVKQSSLTFSTELFPGTYSATAALCTSPNGRLLVPEQFTIGSTAASIRLDVPIATVSGSLRVNGLNKVGSCGFSSTSLATLSFADTGKSQYGAGTVSVSATNEATFSATLGPGQYKVTVNARQSDCSDLFSQTLAAPLTLIAGANVAVLDLSAPNRVVVSGTVSVNGTPLAGSGCKAGDQLGQVTFRSSDGRSYSFPMNEGPSPRFTGTVAAGTYDVGVMAGFGDCKTNMSLVGTQVETGLVIASDRTFAFQVKNRAVTGTITVGAEVPPGNCPAGTTVGQLSVYASSLGLLSTPIRAGPSYTWSALLPVASLSAYVTATTGLPCDAALPVGEYVPVVVGEIGSVEVPFKAKPDRLLTGTLDAPSPLSPDSVLHGLALELSPVAPSVGSVTTITLAGTGPTYAFSQRVFPGVYRLDLSLSSTLVGFPNSVSSWSEPLVDQLRVP